MNYRKRLTLSLTLFLLLAGWLYLPQQATASTAIVDSAGNQLTFSNPPQRVVSLVPTAAETLFALGCQGAVAGLTRHDSTLPGAWEKTIVGGYFSPSGQAVEALNPDLVIAAPHHQKSLPPMDAKILIYEAKTLADADRNIRMLGKIFNKQKEAEGIITRNQAELNHIRSKTDKIPPEKRKRVLRLMGRKQVMTPGDDSFQNELIAAAGGIPPHTGKNGAIVPITLDEWREFNPQVIYGCGGDLPSLRELLQTPGWREVDAVKNHQMYSLPCDLTCRAGTHTGYFVSWLSSLIYTNEFSDPAQFEYQEKIRRERAIPLDLPYVKKARIIYSNINDFENKTLLIEFNTPQTIASTLEGQRQKVEAIGNHYSPPPCWALGHQQGLEFINRHICQVLDLPVKKTSFLVTGADMDNLAVKTTSYKEMRVTALVTAGVKSNAVRMSRDTGAFYEPGTINIIILTNMALTPRAMTRAVISATEAKTAALWDMDVRSSYTPLINPATGTGTDNILTVGGQGLSIDNAGGHSKMGELIARAVYDGVKEAVRKQNGLTQGRGVFDRLDERRISIMSLSSSLECECNKSGTSLSAEVEKLLLNPKYAGFIEASLALSDAYERKTLSDLSAFHAWGNSLAAEIAGHRIEDIDKPELDKDLPVVINAAFEYLFAGVMARGY